MTHQGWHGQIRILAYYVTLFCRVVLPIISMVHLLPLLKSAWRNRKWL